jgi:hypothetical protein
MSILRRIPLLLFAISAWGCSSVIISDYKSWCAYVHDRKKGDYDISSMDRKAVKAGIVAEWDKIVVENSAAALGVPLASISSNTVLAEMRRLHLTGVRAEGDTIVFGLAAIPPTEIAVGKTSSDVYAAQYASRMKIAQSKDAASEMDQGMYCLYTGLNLFFARVVIQTSEGSTTINGELFEKLKKFM